MSETFELVSAPAPAGVTLLRARGYLYAQHVPLLVARCNEVRAAGLHLVLNLSGVTVIASSGIGALLALMEEFRQTSQTLRVAAVSPAVGSVIRLLNLDQFLNLDESEDSALAALKAA